LANATHPTLVKKIIGFHDEKMVDRKWLLRRDGALCCASVGSTAGSSISWTSAPNPEFTYARIDFSSRELANASGYTHRKST
jgi:hypothetical protein